MTDPYRQPRRRSRYPAEGISPLRWRIIMLLTRSQQVRFIYHPPEQPASWREIHMYDRYGYQIGRLVWQVCDPCRTGIINKISINPEWHRQGLGRRLILRAHRDGPDYTWRTSGQSSDAQKFFPVLTAETGAAFTRAPTECRHLSDARYGRTQPKPRPVLDRGI